MNAKVEDIVVRTDLLAVAAMLAIPLTWLVMAVLCLVIAGAGWLWSLL